MKRSIKIFLFILTIFIAFKAIDVSAHEVYVLPPDRIQQDLTSPSLNPFYALENKGDLVKFFVSGLIYALVIMLVMALSFTKLSRPYRMTLQKIKIYAHPIGRIFLGVALVASGYFNSLYGPELPLSLYGSPEIIKILLMICGTLLIFGLLTRPAAAVSIIIYFYALFKEDYYIITYIDYLVLMLLFLISGAGRFSLDRFLGSNLSDFEAKYGGLLIRIGLGVTLLWSAIYVKFMHAQLALDVVNQYGLTRFFPGSPLFVVLGSGIVEMLIALFFIFGVEVRFNSIFFIFWVTLSLFFFGEAVWPHIILYGAAIAVFCYGYDKYTIEEKILKRVKEPLF